ncbi:MAG: cytochrome b N-terminal domain-containing protein [Chloroflexota bacterium]
MPARPSFFSHLHPPHIPQREASFKYTWGMGGISIALFLILLVTGLLEMFFYEPTIEGAYQSVKLIAYVAPYGWLIRNLHYWAAQAMVVAVTLHALRVVITGGYKKRRFNYLLGLLLLILTLLADFTGYVLRWDDSGVWALTVGTNVIRATGSNERADEQIQLGEQIFTTGSDRAPACTLCHSLDDVVLVGPSLKGVATRAADRAQNQSAREYIRASILTPSAYKVRGFETSTMYPNYAVDLSKEQVDALVAFLLTQK